jgi:hypothetical protein
VMNGQPSKVALLIVGPRPTGADQFENPCPLASGAP